MRQKITRTIALISFLTIVTATIPSGYATQWSPDMRLTWNTETDWAPSIIQAKDEEIWVVWHSYRTGNADIFYKVYDASKVHPWSPETRLTTDPNADITPSIMQAKDGELWVVWSTNRTGNYDIFYKVYDGVFWSPDTELTTDPNIDELPSIMRASNGDIWVVWDSDRNLHDLDLYYKVYNGTHWSPDTPLPHQAAEDDWGPSITQTANGEIWFVWVREDNIYHETYNGTHWSPDNALTNDPNISDWHPSIMQASDDNIWVVWDSDRNSEQDDIYYKVYNGTWSPDTRLTFDPADDLMPSIMQDTNETIWIAWASWRFGNLDIYYKTDHPPTYIHDIAIISVSHNPDTTVAYRGLNLSIEVVPQNQGVKGEYFEVNCYANSTVIGSKTIHLSAGQLMPISFAWNTLNTAPGTYVTSANASVVQDETDTADNTLFNGVIQVRILGDADFSGVVRLHDFLLWWENYGKTPEQWPPNVYPDFNNDNAVTMIDFDIWRENYGATCP